MNAEDFRRMVERTHFTSMPFWFINPDYAKAWLDRNPWVYNDVCPCPWAERYLVSAEVCLANRNNGGICGRRALADFFRQATEDIFPDSFTPLTRVVRPNCQDRIGQLMLIHAIIRELRSVTG